MKKPKQDDIDKLNNKVLKGFGQHVGSSQQVELASALCGAGSATDALSDVGIMLGDIKLLNPEPEELNDMKDESGSPSEKSKVKTEEESSQAGDNSQGDPSPDDKNKRKWFWSQ